jgi:hypothetical protein
VVGPLKVCATYELMVSQAVGPTSAQRISSGPTEWRKLLEGAFAAAWVETIGVLVTRRAKQAAYEDGVEAAGLSIPRRPGSTPAERLCVLSIAAA